ncbi:CC0125/CC1285 family lipoprotein [Brevundimonas aveniformis]|uniref:CC0125/CC1285 family lipoprotein n=1 Tax=Brevundimonas aveniformis TaxID=370977 RepID=UPI000412C32E|nr:hypothetical protein [Brevundimonas aveniformis]
MKKLFAVLAGSLVLTACATPTVYAPEGYGGQRGGYAEQRVQEDRWAVAFSGNSLTSRETVEMYLLYRAAELTVQSGYDWFVTDYRETEADTRYYSNPDPWFRGSYGPYWGPNWRFYRGGYWTAWDPWYRDMDMRQATRYEARSEIVMGRGVAPAGERHAFDAREVMQNLGPRVARPGAYG